MKTQYYTAASLDGFIATSDDSLEWLFPFADINATSYPEFITQVGTLAMGSATYAWIVRHVVKPDSPTPGAWPYQPPAWVFSRRALPRIAGADIRFVQGDMRPMADNRESMEDLQRILAAREPLYGKADLEVDTSTHSVAHSVRLILERRAAAMAHA